MYIYRDFGDLNFTLSAYLNYYDATSGQPTFTLYNTTFFPLKSLSCKKTTVI